MVYKTTYRLILLVLLLQACTDKEETVTNVFYDGPIMTTENLVLTYSDSGRVAIKLTTAVQKRFDNGNEVYPKTVYVTFFNKNGVEYSSLRGDSAEYTLSTNKYLLMGNVFFYNREQQQSLSSDELTWSPNEKKVYTDKKVTVNTPTDKLEGVGMEATEDFSNYRFKRVTGIFMVDSLITQPPQQDSTTKKKILRK